MGNVHQRLPKQKAVRCHHQAIVAGHVDGLLLLRGEDAQVVAHFAGELSQLYLLGFGGNLSTFHASQREERLDEVVEPLGFFQHAADGFA